MRHSHYETFKKINRPTTPYLSFNLRRITLFFTWLFNNTFFYFHLISYFYFPLYVILQIKSIQWYMTKVLLNKTYLVCSKFKRSFNHCFLRIFRMFSITPSRKRLNLTLSSPVRTENRAEMKNIDKLTLIKRFQDIYQVPFRKRRFDTSSWRRLFESMHRFISSRKNIGFIARHKNSVS